MQKTAISLTLGLFSTILLVLPAFAQESPSSTQTTSYDQLVSDYNFQLEEYRKAEDIFNLDRAEYYKLDTLASKDKAVVSLKNLMILRPLVLEVYLSALSVLLEPAQGIDVAQKQIALDQIKSTQVLLTQHRLIIPGLAEKTEVLEESNKFQSEISPHSNEAIYRTLSLLAQGRVQRVFDQLILHTNQFKQNYVEPIPDPNKKAFINRGLKDVDAQNQIAKTSLDKTFNNFSRLNNQEKKPNPQSVFSQTIKDLQPAYSAINKSLRFLKELETKI